MGDVGVRWKASNCYWRWNSTVPNTRNIPSVQPLPSQLKPPSGFSYDEIKCFPMARRHHRGVTTLDSPRFYSISLLCYLQHQLQPCTCPLHPTEAMGVWVFTQQNRFLELLPICKTDLYKNLKSKESSPNGHRCPQHQAVRAWIDAV